MVSGGPVRLPDWLRPLATAVATLRPEQLSMFLPPETGGRASSVLILLGEDDAGPGTGPDVLLMQRSATLRQHAGQPSFPGGAAEADDTDEVATALREAAEEAGVDPAGVQVVAALPALWLPPSGFVVTPVLAWWHTPSPLVAQASEVELLRRVPVTELVDPAVRCRVRHPSGYSGPAFDIDGMLVWGFTAGLLDRVLELAGWAVAWDHDRVLELPAEQTALSVRNLDPEALAGLPHETLAQLPADVLARVPMQVLAQLPEDVLALLPDDVRRVLREQAG